MHRRVRGAYVILAMSRPGALHGDPADRIIVATARAHSCPLVTADDKLLVYPCANVVHPRTLSVENGE